MSPFWWLLLLLCFSGLGWGLAVSRSVAEADRKPPPQAAPNVPRGAADAARDGSPRVVLLLALACQACCSQPAQVVWAVPSIGVSCPDKPVAQVHPAVS